MSLALLLLHVRKGKEYFVYKRLKDINEVKSVWFVVYGFYNLICMVELDDAKELEQSVLGKIRKMSYIIQVDTEIISPSLLEYYEQMYLLSRLK